MTTSGLAASGLVSNALTKIASGAESTAGILLNGRVLKAVHNPESTRLETISSLDNLAKSS